MIMINLLLLCIIVILSTSLGFNIISNNNIRLNRMKLNMNTDSDPLLLRAARGE